MDLVNNRLFAEFIHNLILKKFQILESHYNYKPFFKIDEDNLFERSFEVEYVNTKINRKIAICYFVLKHQNIKKHSFSLSITRTPYLSPVDFFSLEYYLNFRGLQLKSFIENEFNENLANDILTNLATTLLEYTNSIIDGSAWLGDFYPRKD